MKNRVLVVLALFPLSSAFAQSQQTPEPIQRVATYRALQEVCLASTLDDVELTRLIVLTQHQTVTRACDCASALVTTTIPAQNMDLGDVMKDPVALKKQMKAAAIVCSQ